jgi:ornithine decarboxylase
MDIYPTPAELIRDVPFDQPILGFGPRAAKRAGRWFCGNFPGETLYAVRANDSPAVLRTLFDAESSIPASYL